MIDGAILIGSEALQGKARFNAIDPATGATLEPSFSSAGADAVAAATAGLAGLLHIPNGRMFFMGMLSMMFAAGCSLVFTIFSGVTMNVPGEAPMEHFSFARLQTCIAI